MKREEITVEDFLVHKVDVYRFGTGGPRVLVTAGLHGAETTGQYVAYRLIKSLRDADINGEVVVVPRGNPAAFRRMQRTSPYDERDMNRIFPGDQDGSATEVLAHQIWEIALECDYIVDLHCCGIYGSSYTLAQYREYEFARDLAGKIDIPLVVQSAGAEGQLFVEACAEDIPAVIIELPGGGRSGVIDLAAAEQTRRALLGLLRVLEVLPGDAPEPAPSFCDPLRRIAAPRDGLYLPQIAPGGAFEAGQVLGTVQGEELTVDFSGWAVIARPAGYVFRDASLLVLAPKGRNDDL